MLRKIRIVLAAICFLCITLLFMDVTGALHPIFGWLARLQFLPALLAMNVGIVALLIVLTLLFGRVYCSVICPMGVFQDIISWFRGKLKKKNRYRFSYSPARNWVRYAFLAAFIIALIAGIHVFVAILAPYSAYGRIAGTLFAPVYQAFNNLFAFVAEHYESYSFYSRDIWFKGLSTVIVSVVTLIVFFIFAWKKGRMYCNTVCPVGTLLGLVSRFSVFVPVIDTDKCRNCGLCSRRCKSSCINMKEHTIDYSRCVACMDCIDACSEGAISYRFRYGRSKSRESSTEPQNQGRRMFIASTVMATAAATVKAQEMKVDGGLAKIQKKEIPQRRAPLKPAGSMSIRNFEQHCTACQLCVSACPNGVLRPSVSLLTLMQPEMSFERGFCRPECTTCSDICPAGAIVAVSKEEKSSIQIGHAEVTYDNCLAYSDGVKCGNCARHCPTGAISMVYKNPEDKNSARIPVVNEEHCIGCGACEYLCPSRPFSAITVHGHEVHKTI